MRRIFTLALCIITGSCVAADPPSPVDPSEEWGEPTYKKIPENEYDEENWDYLSEYATLHIIKQLCSACKPMRQELADKTNGIWPNDFSVVVDGGKYPGMMTLSIEPEHHIGFSYELVTAKHSYRVQLVMVESVPARESMRLQQEVLRMVGGWEPK